MIKKTFSFILLFGSFSIILTGCSSKSSEENTKKEQEQSEIKTEDSADAFTFDGNSNGTAKDSNGNEVIIKQK